MEKNLVVVTDNPELTEEVTVVFKVSHETYDGKSDSLVQGSDGKTYLIVANWENEETEVVINKTYEVTGKFGSKELTGFDSEDSICAHFNIYDAKIDK